MMNEEENVNPAAVPDDAETELVSLLQQMQQQLFILEKKVDLLLGRSQGKSTEERRPGRSFSKRPFSKPPFRSFEHPQRHGRGDRERGPRDRDSVPGHFYERRPQEKSRTVSPRKKPFGFKRKDNE